MDAGWSSDNRTVNGVSLHVVEAGPADGPLLILLHGFPEFWWAWRRQITPFAMQGFHVVVPDMRGYNTSARPKGIASYRLGTLTADIVALADSFNAPRFHLVGHDWGGVVAWDIAASHPDRVERMVVLDGPHPDLWRRIIMRHPTQALRSAYAAFCQIPWLPERILGASRFALLRAMMQRTARPGTFAPAELDRYVEAWSHPGALTAMLNYYRALPRRRAPDPPRRIAVPTRILWGENDVALSHHVARSALDLCDDGELKVSPGTTHWLHHEQPDHIATEILGFLGEPG